MIAISRFTTRFTTRFSAHRSRRATAAMACVSALLVAACAPNSGKRADSSAAASSSGGVDLTGAGATFPYPIYSRWFAEYAAKTGVKINYQDIGSGGGIKQLSEQTVDFGASDAPMSNEEMGSAKGGPIIHIPSVVGVVAIAYNLPTLTQPLKLTGPVVADIFLGKIAKWNDRRIAALNPGAALPASDILFAHRSEASGTTFILTDYLSAVSPAWRDGPGHGKSVQWPTGIGERGNEGVSGHIKQTPGAIGYVELAYVKQNHLAAAALQNAAGQFVEPSAASATAAADAAVASLPANSDLRVSIVNSPGAQTYPITSFTWFLVYAKMPDVTKARKLDAFLKWALTDGQKSASALDYAPLPAALIATLTSRVDSLTAGPPQ
jgi:phosphate transport system substrate-binding protein